MSQKEYPSEFLERLKAITAKRPKAVIDHILEYGFITTEDLKARYGYNHPPRAARDVREQGIPLETFRVKNSEGRSIAAYRFADLSKVLHNRLGGRSVFSKDFKSNLIRQYSFRCAVCDTRYEERYFQVDHCVPYEVSGDADHDSDDIHLYMPLCSSCNRAKSWSCEHCKNWIEDKSPQICQSCYWASPASYQHIALRRIRRLDITWVEDEVELYEQVKIDADIQHQSLSDYLKSILKKSLDEGNVP